MLEAPKRKYKLNFVSQVICQLTFVDSGGFSDVTMKQFKDALDDAYGELSSQEQRGLVVHNDGSSISTENQNQKIWQLISRDESHAINIMPGSLAVVFNAYKEFAENSIVIERVIKNFRSVFNDIEIIQRLGLRYVNVVKIDETNINWGDYINPKLADSSSFVSIEELRRSMNGMVVTHDDGSAINFNYGIFNQYFPGPIVDNEFILDYDTYNTEPIKIDSCMPMLKQFNKTMAIYFENSINDKLRGLMEVVDDEQ